MKRSVTREKKSRPFGLPAETLDLARAIATDVEEVYGTLEPHEFEALRERGPWNDMSSVQAVLCALSPPYRANIAALAEANRKRVSKLVKGSG